MDGSYVNMQLESISIKREPDSDSDSGLKTINMEQNGSPSFDVVMGNFLTGVIVDEKISKDHWISGLKQLNPERLQELKPALRALFQHIVFDTKSPVMTLVADLYKYAKKSQECIRAEENKQLKENRLIYQKKLEMSRRKLRKMSIDIRQKEAQCLDEHRRLHDHFEQDRRYLRESAEKMNQIVPLREKYNALEDQLKRQRPNILKLDATCSDLKNEVNILTADAAKLRDEYAMNQQMYFSKKEEMRKMTEVIKKQELDLEEKKAKIVKDETELLEKERSIETKRNEQKIQEAHIEGANRTVMKLFEQQTAFMNQITETVNQQFRPPPPQFPKPPSTQNPLDRVREWQQANSPHFRNEPSSLNYPSSTTMSDSGTTMIEMDPPSPSILEEAPAEDVHAPADNGDTEPREIGDIGDWDRLGATTSPSGSE